MNFYVKYLSVVIESVVPTRLFRVQMPCTTINIHTTAERAHIGSCYLGTICPQCLQSDTITGSYVRSGSNRILKSFNHLLSHDYSA